MDHVSYLECLICHKRYSNEDIAYVCPDHGSDGVVDVVYDYGAIGASKAELVDRGMWRYRALLPMHSHIATPPLPVGGTPLWQAPGVGEPFGLEDVWIKDDTRNPTGSLKDRASAMAIVRAEETGSAVVATASTGNAAAALAGLSASVGSPCVIFVPADAPPAKIVQPLAYGATVFVVDGTYDDAYELCLRAGRRFGWYIRNTGFNPYMSEGKKTVAYEICEQLGWASPDAIVVPVGDGCILGAVHKGLVDLLALGWIDRMPRLIGVQATGSNYLASAWEEGEDVLTKPPIRSSTVADSINVGLPRDRLKAMRAVHDSRGGFVTVDDSDILSAVGSLASRTGVFAEPAAAAPYAGLPGAVAEDLLGPSDRVVLLVTGTGLKDVEAASRSAREPIPISPTLEAVEAALERSVP